MKLPKLTSLPLGAAGALVLLSAIAIASPITAAILAGLVMICGALALAVSESTARERQHQTQLAELTLANTRAKYGLQ